ncbi:MAG: glycosyltransferase family 9 protein [Saprospiraceae bacterium]|nr:glycosyltransferase family 9 protein [Saprospiraceae bacterium]|tara:strand:+ start:5198 stop:6217 length:1020 start_codon:yes stop_codon:yes gene_type:complete
MSRSKKKKALVIRFSSIGDIILTTPVIRSLALQGDYEVHLLTHQKFTHVLKDNPHLEKIHSFEESIWTTSKKISNHHYDIIIDLHKSIRSYLLRLFLLRKVYGFNKLRIKRWWRTKINKDLKDDNHIALRFIDALTPLKLSYDGGGLDYYIPQKDRIVLSGRNSTKKIALIPGANFYSKTIPTEKLIAIISQWPDLDFHILGGEKEIGKFNELNIYPNVQNHCGQLSLAQSASIIEQSDLIICTDTALMHISAALKKNIISIWGGTVPGFGFYPFFPPDKGSFKIIENVSLSCRPCSKSGKTHCPKSHFNCMKTISTNEIQKEIKNYIEMNHLHTNHVI